MPYRKQKRRGYRSNAGRVQRIQNHNRKRNNPVAKFTLSKYYYVAPPAGGAAPMSGALLEINMSTPFQPLSVKSGLWTANDTNNEPYGLDSDIYAQYKHVTVLGSHVTANILDSPDNPPAGTNTQVEGVASLIRTTDSGVIQAQTLNNEIRDAYGSKMRSFTCGDGIGGNLQKSARLSNGYSARKTWSQSAMTNEELKIANQSGSSNVPADNTYMALMIRCADDNRAGDNLKVIRVQLKITYILKFTEPTAQLNIPLPLSSYLRMPSFRPSNRFWQYATAGATAGALGALTYGKRRAIRGRAPYRALPYY